LRGPAELIEQLRRAYGAQEKKLTENAPNPGYEAQNRKLMSTTDPDAPCVRHGKKGGTGDSRPRYKHHRAVDDKCGVVTAVETTTGDVEENSQAEALIEQHEENTGAAVDTFVGDRQFGTVDTYRRLQKRGIRTHMGQPQSGSRRHEEIYPTEKFVYDPAADHYVCPAGKKLISKGFNPRRQYTTYQARKADCASCPLRSACTRSKAGRTINRHADQELIDLARQQATSPMGRKDRSRRRHLAEGSFADAARHHFKKARWRRLERQSVQDLLIAAIQNIKILVGSRKDGRKTAEMPRFFPWLAPKSLHGPKISRPWPHHEEIRTFPVPAPHRESAISPRPYLLRSFRQQALHP
jgi:hypothetical protein